MRALTYFILTFCCLSLCQCKSAAPTGPGASAPSLLQVTSILDSVQSRFIFYANQTNGNPWQAIELTTTWLQSQPNVKTAYSIDSTYISIELTSGLHTAFNFDQTNDNGYSVFRGGGGSNVIEDPVRSTASLLSLHTITNKRVLIFAADTKSLPQVNGQIARDLDQFTSSGLNLDVTVLKDEQCSYGAVEHFGDYGLVIMDTHGTNQTFRVGSTLDLSNFPSTEDMLKASISDQIAADAYTKLIDGRLMLSAELKGNPKRPGWFKSVIPIETREIDFTSQYLDLLAPMPNTIIFGNMCFSGWIATQTVGSNGKVFNVANPIGAAFIRKQLISYYAYVRNTPSGSSRAVYDEFAAAMEDSLVKRLVHYKDSTGIANLKPDNLTEYVDLPIVDNHHYDDLFLRHFGADDYSYQKCGDSLVDDRDGQKYPTVCIGTQVWMARNLNYNSSTSICYDHQTGNCDIYGKLYDFASVMQGSDTSNLVPSGVRGICPKGWHVPSVNEWQILFNFLGGGAVAGGKLKSDTALWNGPNAGATNGSGFSALPGGFVYDFSSAGASQNLGNDAYFASTTRINGQFAWMAAFLQSTQSAAAFTPESPTKAGLSCRCAKDP